MSYVKALERTLDNTADSLEMKKLIEVLEQASLKSMDDNDTTNASTTTQHQQHQHSINKLV